MGPSPSLEDDGVCQIPFQDHMGLLHLHGSVAPPPSLPSMPHLPREEAMCLMEWHPPRQGVMYPPIIPSGTGCAAVGLIINQTSPLEDVGTTGFIHSPTHPLVY